MSAGLVDPGHKTPGNTTPCRGKNGGEAAGTGTYGRVNLFENGRFAPGASASPAVFSPAVVAASQVSFGARTTLEA